MAELISVKKDTRGRALYQYACRCCGTPTSYKRKHKSDAFDPICHDCQKKNSIAKMKAKKQNENNDIWNEAVMAFSRNLNIVLDKDKHIVITKKKIKDIIEETRMEMTK